jgi:hypothetical protein
MTRAPICQLMVATGFRDPQLVGSPEAGWLVITPVWNTDA